MYQRLATLTTGKLQQCFALGESGESRKRLALPSWPAIVCPMIELEIYAHGLRKADNALQLKSQMDLLPHVRYKVDVNHDIVYFEFDDVTKVTQTELTAVFTDIGLHPRFVGQMPEGVRIS
jgi:hypothetical protein